MLRKLLITKIPITKVAQNPVSKRNYAYYCHNPGFPIVPACYWNVLENGVKVISEQTCSPLAAVTMLVATGPQQEVACNNGITYFVERLAFQGFRGKDFKKNVIEEKIRGIGARLDCKTTREYQMFTATCPPEFVADILEIFSKILKDLDFSNIERVREDIYNDLIETENDPKQLCFDYLHQCAFQGTSLSLPVIGPYDNYLRFDKKYTSEYIKEMYTPKKITIACSAPLTHEQVLYATQRVFSKFKQVCVPQPGPRRFTGSQIMYRRDDMPFSYNAIAVEAPGYNDSLSYLQMRVMAELMGAWDRCQGVDRRVWPETAMFAAMGDMCESYEAFYIPYKEVGLFGVYFVAENGTELEDMVYNIQTQFMKLCTSVNNFDVARASNKLKLKMGKELLGAQNSCADMALQMNYFGERKNLCAQWSRVESVEDYDIKNVADQYIFDRCLACSSVGPTESLPDYNRLRSGMYWARL